MNPGTRKALALVLGPLLGACAAGATLASGMAPDAAWTAAITILCATWWVLEPIPIPATSLVPFAAFPLTGVLDHKDVATAYGHTLVLLLLGGFILSTAMAKAGAHRRLAVGMVRMVGGKGGRRLVLGFMLATAVSSMWISNTATVLMLLPVAMAVLDQARDGGDDQLTVPLLLGIAYAASIGGMGTPVGTPPNVVLMGVYREVTGTEISFFDWMKVGIPAVMLLLPVTWLWLTRNLKESRPFALPELGAWRPAEKRVLVVFLLTAVLWVTRTAPNGGWGKALDVGGAGDATVALLAVVIMFLVPDGDKGRLLDWETARDIPWGLLILFGGGIAIARAFDASGLAAAMGSFLADDAQIATWPPVLMVGVLCLSVTFLTEVTSNTATTTLLMPILAAAAIAAGLAPEVLMVPAALSASCAFMLPVATAPNAIMFGTGRISTRVMASEGLALNLAGAMLLTACCLLLT